MELNTLGFIQNEALYYPKIIKDIPKSNSPFQPVYEGLTNSLEAIRLLENPSYPGEITIKVYYEADLFEQSHMSKIVIEDNGIGFNDKEFKRFLTFKDNRKGYNNQGSGRIQFIHSFGTAAFSSIYMNDDKFKLREFHLSKNITSQNNHAIAVLDNYADVEATERKTTLTLSNLLNKADKTYLDATIENYKEIIITRYIQYFCAHREALPKIILQAYKGDAFERQIEITQSDIPEIDSRKPFTLNYHNFSTGTDTVLEDKSEEFEIKAFKIPKAKLDKNAIKLTSKDEIVDEKGFTLNLNVLSADDDIDNNRYLFLISSDYINKQDSDARGQLRIPRRENYKSQINLFDEDLIFLNDIEKIANETIISMYDSFQVKAEEKKQKISDLKKMFLLNEKLLSEMTFSINDTEEKILERIYVYESKQMAKGDAELKKQFDKLVSLDPKKPGYDATLNVIVEELVKEIPHQNRAALTHYVARRKMVLDLYDHVLNHRMDIQTSGRDATESILHNLLFTQRTDVAENSDLWILNEDFILFKGVSEARLMDITLNGQKIFKDTLTADEEKYLKSLGENRKTKRPDVLLFPDEGKCVILEFKTPNTNVADHLTEINYYASLILNFTKDEFPFTTFYGYLIGEDLEPLDVKFHDADFQDSAHFGYLFRPAKAIFGRFKDFQGSLYTEVIKYSTLHKRAEKRNEILISKLFNGIKSDDAEV